MLHLIFGVCLLMLHLIYGVCVCFMQLVYGRWKSNTTAICSSILAQATSLYDKVSHDDGDDDSDDR